MPGEQTKTEQLLQLLEELRVAQSRVAEAQSVASQCVNNLLNMFAGAGLSLAPFGFQTELAQMHSMLNDLIERSGGVAPHQSPTHLVSSSTVAMDDSSSIANMSQVNAGSCEPEDYDLPLSDDFGSEETSQGAYGHEQSSHHAVVDPHPMDIDLAESPVSSEEFLHEDPARTSTQSIEAPAAQRSARQEALDTNAEHLDALATLTRQATLTSHAEEDPAGQDEPHAQMTGGNSSRDQLNQQQSSAGTDECDTALATLTGNVLSASTPEMSVTPDGDLSEDDALNLLTGGGGENPFGGGSQLSMTEVRDAFGTQASQASADDFPNDSLASFESLPVKDQDTSQTSRPQKDDGDSFADFLSNNNH